MNALGAGTCIVAGKLLESTARIPASSSQCEELFQQREQRVFQQESYSSLQLVGQDTEYAP